MTKIVTITVIIGTVFISICIYLLWRWMAKRKGNIPIKINTITRKSCYILEIAHNYSGNQQGKKKQRGSYCSTERKHIKTFLLRG